MGINLWENLHGKILGCGIGKEREKVKKWNNLKLKRGIEELSNLVEKKEKGKRNLRITMQEREAGKLGWRPKKEI